MNQLIAVVLVLLAAFGASLAIERVLGRSRKDMHKPGWYAVFISSLIPACGVVYAKVPAESTFLYAAYAIAGGLAALLAQCFFGVKLAKPDSESR